MTCTWQDLSLWIGRPTIPHPRPTLIWIIFSDFSLYKGRNSISKTLATYFGQVCLSVSQQTDHVQPHLAEVQTAVRCQVPGFTLRFSSGGRFPPHPSPCSTTALNCTDWPGAPHCTAAHSRLRLLPENAHTGHCFWWGEASMGIFPCDVSSPTYLFQPKPSQAPADWDGPQLGWCVLSHIIAFG